MKTYSTKIAPRPKGRVRRVLGRIAAAAMLATTAHGGDPELPLDLGSAQNFVILAKTGISTVPDSDITGDMGVSPITATAITGFSLIMDSSGEFSTSAQVDGKIYASDYMLPTPSMLTTAISDMETAYVNAAGRPDPDTTEFMSGDLSGQTMYPGLHKWGTGVLINSDVTLDALGNPEAIFIFQIAGDLTLASGQRVILSGGAQAKNVFWQVGGGSGAVIGTYAHFEGVILTEKAITVQTGASFNGKLLAQTRVNLDQNNIMDANLISPPEVVLEIVSEHGIGTPPVGVYTNAPGTPLTNSITGMETLGGTQYVNTGWAMTGNEPLAGNTSSMGMVHTNDAVLTWQWSTNYLLTTLAASGGGVTGSLNGFYPAGSNVTVIAVPDPGYSFMYWTGDVGGAPNTATQNLTMVQARTVLAHFLPEALDCGTPVTLRAPGEGAFMELDLSAIFPGTGWSYGVVSTQPGVMSAAIASGDLLRLEALSQGVTLITVNAVKPGDARVHSFPVQVVGPPNVLTLEMAPNEPWNPRFEQRIVVENNTGIDCPAVGLRLLFSDLRPGIVIENQTGLAPPPDGRPMMEWSLDFPNGATESIHVVYLATGAFRPDQYPPTVEVQFILPNEPPVPDQAGVPNIESIRMLADGRVLLEFASIPGNDYEIDHAPSVTGLWQTVPLQLHAGGNRTQWIDYGPPATPPLTESRFYRVRGVSP